MLHLKNCNNAEESVQHEEKRLATWGTDVPDDLVLDKKLAESLKKVNISSLCKVVYHWIFQCLLFFRSSFICN